MIESIILVVGVVIAILIVLPYLRSSERRRNIVDPKRVSDELRGSSQSELAQNKQTHPDESPQPVLKRAEVMAERRRRQPVDQSADQHELLQRWLREGKIDMSDQEFMEWLPNQTPDTWHAIVCNWNWDCGSEPLLWIVSRPNCDFGTAFHIFFVEASNWMTTLTWEELEYPSYQQSWKTCKMIADRWERNDFGSAELALDGYSQAESYRQMEKNALEADKKLAWIVPEYVYEYKGTRPQRSDFTWMDGTLMHSFESWKQRQGI